MENRKFARPSPLIFAVIIIFMLSGGIFAQSPLRNPNSPQRPESPKAPLLPCIVPVQVLNDYAGLTAYSGITAADGSSERAKHIAQQIAGPGITVNSAVFTGAPRAVGLFDNGACLGTTLTTPGIGNGAVLSTGNVRNVIDKVSGGPLIGPGPDSIQYGQDSLISTANGTPGDAGLENILLISGDEFPTYDASSLTIKFVPTMSYIEMYYVFASDEYNEFVGQINDIFAFFVNGQNVALLPDSTEPVAINTVNNGSRDLYAEPWGGYQNPEFYIDNSDHYFNTEMDGMTVVMKVEARVIPNQENTMRLVVADTADDRGDSNVFIQKFSLKAIQRFTDTDGDGAPDLSDNCPGVYNPTQANSAGSGKAGDACRDTDGDGFLDVAQDLNGDGVIDKAGDKCPDFADPSNVCTSAPVSAPAAISFAALKGNGFVPGPGADGKAHFNVSAKVSKRNPNKLEVHLVYQDYDGVYDHDGGYDGDKNDDKNKSDDRYDKLKRDADEKTKQADEKCKDADEKVKDSKAKQDAADKAKQEADKAKQSDAKAKQADAKAKQEAADKAKQECDKARQEADKAKQEAEKAREECEKARQDASDKSKGKSDDKWSGKSVSIAAATAVVTAPQREKVQIHIHTTTTHFYAADTMKGPGVRFTAPCTVSRNGKLKRQLNTCVVYALDSDGGQPKNTDPNAPPDRFGVVVTEGPDGGYTSGTAVDLTKGDIRATLAFD